MIQTLLDHGAHFDTVNTEKKAFFNLLKGQPLHEVGLRALLEIHVLRVMTLVTTRITVG